MDEYRKAEICLNGHPTIDDFEYSGDFASPHCSDCGAETIRKCPLTATHAVTPIPGHKLHLIRQRNLSRNWIS